MRCLIPVLAVLCVTAGPAWADVMVAYTVDGGGTNTDPLNGLAARATFDIDGTHLRILLENTSTGVPTSFDVSDSLLVSLGWNLPNGVSITAGNFAVIGPGAVGVGSWTGRVAGNSVGEEWIWTNDFGGDLMEPYAQVISTSSGQGGGCVARFDGGSGSVNGPFGGIAANPPLLNIPGNKPAVSNAIIFDLTLSAPITDAQVAAMASASIVEFGSDARYLLAPEPAALLPAVALLLNRRRR